MRGLFALAIVAVSLVLASATTVRLTEVTRTATGEGAEWIFTSSHPDFTNDLFYIAANKIYRRQRDGTTVTFVDLTRLGNITSDVILKRAAINPDNSKDTIILVYARNSTTAEKALYEYNARVATNETRVANYTIELVKYSLNQLLAPVASFNQTSLNQTRRVLISYPAFELQWDLGDVRFIDGLLYVGTGNSIPAATANNIFDFYLQSREAHSLLGKVLRFNTDSTSLTIDNYPFVATGNPYINTTTPPVVYAKGFDWPTSIFRAKGQIWTTDVNAGVADELNILQPGVDFGFPVVEGTSCINPPTGCVTANTILPEIIDPVPANSSYYYALSGAVYIGNDRFLGSFAATPSGDAGAPFHIMYQSNKSAVRASTVDQRNVPLIFYYRDISITALTAENDQSTIYALGAYNSSTQSVIFRVDVLSDTNSAGRLSILIAVIVAVIAALFH